MDLKLKDQLLEFFENYVTPHKQELIGNIISDRTRHLTVVLEDIFKSHNASAVLRSCECFGIQDIHFIEKENEYSVNPYVTRGASKWLTLHNHSDTKTCIKELKKNGYKIVVTLPDDTAADYRNYQPDEKIALIFGTEFSGVSEEMQAAADDFIYIPMKGFTESLNISVSAAILIEDLSYRIRRSSVEWQLTDQEKKDIRLDWYRNIVKRSVLMEEKFIKDQH